MAYTDLIEFADERERWAEQEAVQFERNATYLIDECMPGWLERAQKRGWHPETVKAMYEVALKAQNYRDMANQLRRPRYSRQEQETCAKASGMI